MARKQLQVPVIVGTGSAQFFIEKDIKISPPSPPVFEIKEIRKTVEVIEVKVIPKKIIFNALLRKDINYKTVEHVHDESVNGPLFHLTTKIPFGGFIDVVPVEGEEVKEGDIPELLAAEVEGEIDELRDKANICGVTVFEKLHEKSVVRLTFKVVRVQHVTVEEYSQTPNPPKPYGHTY